MRAAFAEPDTPHMEHPSTWLVDDDGRCVDVYEGGLIIFADKDRDICRRITGTHGHMRDDNLVMTQAYEGQKIGEPDGAANGSQPIRSDTNMMSSAAGSRR